MGALWAPPGAVLRSNARSPGAPSAVLRSNGRPLDAPGAVLRSNARSPGAPGAVLRSNGRSLGAPGALLRSNGRSLGAPGAVLLFPPNDRWLLATIATRLGGLGLRSAARHRAAAFLASRSACVDACRELDPLHALQVSVNESSDELAFQSLNSVFPEKDRIPDPVPPLKQQVLSLALDQASLDYLKDPARADTQTRAHINLLTEPGAGAWLQAIPSFAFDTVIPAPQFVVCLQRRLRLPVFPHCFFCPLCNGVMDTHGDHALVCAAGGDRTVRHNLLRNAAFRVARAAGARPELEKPGLLGPRPLIGILEEDGVALPTLRDQLAGRRPADVFLPSFFGGSRCALDFAVTSGLRCGSACESAADGSHAASSYEARKRSHLDTDTLCKEAGLLFIPMVMEASGGSWGPAARRVWSGLANAAAKLTGESPSSKAEELSQTFSVILHRANARSVLCRSHGLSPADPCPSMASARTALEHAEIRRRAEASDHMMI
eukprot:gene17850-biopygen31019